MRDTPNKKKSGGFLGLFKRRKPEPETQPPSETQQEQMPVNYAQAAATLYEELLRHNEQLENPLQERELALMAEVVMKAAEQQKQEEAARQAELERQRMEEALEAERLAQEAAIQAEQAEQRRILEEMHEPVDATIDIEVEDYNMKAIAIINPPQYGGKEVTHEQFAEALRESKVVYGLDEAAIHEMVESQCYLGLYDIAVGQPPVHGLDGRIIDFFPRDWELEFAKKEDGSIDFKTTNILNNVQADTKICEMIPPVEAIDGCDVYGNIVRGIPGKIPIIPGGKNTKVTQDGQFLVATAEGNLIFTDGRFHVEKVFEVVGNVDNAVGNIDFLGDVIVRGDVLEGFEVRCEGSVIVHGMVEGASIYAGGNINIYKGMNGMQKGTLVAGGKIATCFLENCTVKAKGSIYAESIINSNIMCTDRLNLLNGRGVMIGGTFTVLKGIDAKTIGAETQSGVTTLITLGATPDIVQKMEETLSDLRDINAELESIEKDLNYLESIMGTDMFTKTRQTQYSQLKMQKPLNRMKQRKLKKDLAVLDEQINNVSSSKLSCRSIFPPTQICIGHETMTVQRPQEYCTFYYADGAIKISYR